ncbi:MAG: hypothetical protein DI586_05220 [Micavibrio aeruginosavorus]|uniref:Uncharacterized protein n=1 Tax=Micavibrio aeruginosavorus TaxID=349221 RepID=A0A2W5HJV3_9BACT|nr:MAG: hypothetical protein DI586_05220 [Micavibrio aeruginosavorus]
MLRLLTLLLLLPVSALAQDIPLTCDIEIEFNSTGSGIDASVYQKIMDRVIATPAITEKYVTNIGREGERTLCLKVEEGQLGEVYDDLKSQIPAESHHTWTYIKSRDGREFKTKEAEGLVRYRWQTE